MFKIITPATSANLGPGFDTLGIALNLFNTFYVEKADKLIIEGCEPDFQNEENLLYKAYVYTLRKKAGLYVKFDCQIPVSKGLGSSASLIVAGVLAANYLYNLKLSQHEIFSICTKIENHPDNIAPCLFGGFTSSFMYKDKPYFTKINVNKNYCFSIIIPDYKISTIEARKVIKQEVSLNDAKANIANAINLCLALQNGNFETLKLASEDFLHEPYRKKLLKDYDILKKQALKKGATAFLISGAGPCCLIISDKSNFSKIMELPLNYQIKDLKIHTEQVIIKEEE